RRRALAWTRLSGAPPTRAPPQRGLLAACAAGSPRAGRPGTPLDRTSRAAAAVLEPVRAARTSEFRAFLVWRRTPPAPRARKARAAALPAPQAVVAARLPDAPPRRHWTPRRR